MFDTSPHRILARLVLALSLAAPIMTAAPEQAHAVIIDGVAARINAEIITLYDVRIAATPFMLQREIEKRHRVTLGEIALTCGFGCHRTSSPQLRRSVLASGSWRQSLMKWP